MTKISRRDAIRFGAKATAALLTALAGSKIVDQRIAAKPDAIGGGGASYLPELRDVRIVTQPADNDVLTFDPVLQLWTNAPAAASGAPSDAEYVVTALHAGLSAEVLHAALVHSADQPPEAHAIGGAKHTLSGGTDDQFLRATGATTFAFESVIFARGGTVLSPAVQNIIVWQARFPCTVTQVRGYRVGGTGATINARRNGSSNHLSSALSLTSADTWMDGGAVQNTAYVADDKLEIMVVSVTGSPTQISIQVNFTRP